MDERQARIAVLVGGVMVAGGAFLPWASLGLLSVTGLQGQDGIFAVLIGIAIAAIAAASFTVGPSRTQRILILLLSLAGLGLYALELNQVNSLGTGDFKPQIGSGIILGGIGGLVGILFSNGMGARKPPEPPSG